LPAKRPVGQFFLYCLVENGMAALEIPCPYCGMQLKLPDRKLLGRKARCGKCGQKFLLQEPSVANVESAPTFAAAPEMPGGRKPWVPEPVGSGTVGANLPPARQAAAGPATDVTPAPLELSAVGGLEPDDTVLARVRARRQKAARQRWLGLAGGIILLAVAAGVYYSGALAGGKSSRTRKPRPSASSVADVPEGSSGPTAAGLPAGSPTKGKPITLHLVPMGTRLLVHLRPAVLWETGGTPEEFKACLGPLGTWLEAAIKQECLLAPQRIDEALFAFIPTSRDTFAISVVVRTSEDTRKSELLEKFDGELDDSLERPCYVKGDRAFLILDPRTFALSPQSMAADMVDAVKNPGLPSDGVEALLSQSDRERHFTIVFQMEDLRLGAKTLVPQNALQLLNSTLDWMGDDVEAALWSFHLPRDYGEGFFSEIIVRNKLTKTTATLQKDLSERLAATPAAIRDLAYQIDPATMKLGEAKVVGRFPVMTKMAAAGTHFDTGNRYVSLQTALPERAAPNLALGALLTWNQTTLPGFGKSTSGSPAAPKAQSKLPDTIAERLQKVISVEFRRQFLYAAVDEISNEIGVQFKIEGNDLKMVGVTQNVYQTFKLDNVPATAVLHRMLYAEKLCLVVDEANKIAIITSKQAAADKKLTPFPLAPASNN
jgi:hypothetical protein